MTATTDADLVARVCRLVGERGDPAGALVQVAHAIDRVSSTTRPSTPLVLPRLDSLRGTAAPVDPPDPDGLDVELAALLRGLAPDVVLALLGQVHEGLLDGHHRRRRGAFYTPTDVARGLVEQVVTRLDVHDHDGAPGEIVRVCDPALGGGVFLLAAADALLARGSGAADVVERCLWGSDVDPVAVAVTEASLILWARAHGVDVANLNVVCADPLLEGASTWPDAPPSGFDAVVGNPPFLNQLDSGTSRAAEVTSKLRDRWGPAVFRYTDTAAIFLLAATGLVRPGGIVAMIVPVPVLVTGDADRLRAALLDRAAPVHLWIAHEDVFSIGVRVCAPVLRVRRPEVSTVAVDRPRSAGPAESVVLTRSTGRRFEPIDPRDVDLDALRAAGTWGALVADVFGVPSGATTSSSAAPGRLGDFCRATAGFRDQYYGLRPYVTESGDGVGRRAKLVTSGLVDPARLAWGERTCRFDGRAWVAPEVDLDRLGEGDPSLGAWAAARLVPKVVVATQTRVLEAAVDVEGDWFPSVPTIALVADRDRLWEAAAVVLAPPTTAWAMNRHIGAALSADALKVSAKQLLDAPLPADDDEWAIAVGHLRAASVATQEERWREELHQFGAAMTRAYAAPRDVLSWWIDRLPRWR
jgi:hypothetical protein